MRFPSTYFRALIALLAVIALAGCSPTDIPMKGVVGGFSDDYATVFISHEAVEDVMPEMSMPFNADSAETARLAVGDAVSFRLHIRRSRSWITDIKRIPRSDVNLSTTVPGPRRLDATVPSILVPGDAFPSVRLVDQKDNAFNLPYSDASATLVDFIYTRCPLPEYCPLLSTRFRQVQADTDGDVRLVSITIEPDFDTPDVLDRYGQRYGALYDRWRFATGDSAALGTLYSSAGVNVFPDAGTLNHNLATILLDATGRVVRIWRDTDATVDEMLFEIELTVGASSSTQTSVPGGGR